ncbi:MAG: hypothetical protein L6R28_25490 [Planctomycetes bacterium]|nr:hypothetical protein [Planctomycetota bacterium]
MRTIEQIGTVFFLDGLVPVTTDRVRASLEKSGLDPQAARDLAKRFCFSRAKNKLRDEGLIDEVGETPARWTWQLSRRYREANRLGYEFEAAFWFDKAAQAVGADNRLLLEKVQGLFAKYGALYLATDITKVVRRIFDAQKGLVRLRHAGAVYFVPRENRSLMEKVVAFVEGLGGECVTVPVGPENTLVRDKALAMLVEAVKTDVGKIVAEMRELQTSGEGLSKRKAKNRWKELGAQLERVRTFARSLSADAEGLLNQVRVNELDLALVAKADLDVIAALAHAGKVNGALGQIVETVYEGELPTIRSPRVRAAQVLLEETGVLPLPVDAQLKAPAMEA